MTSLFAVQTRAPEPEGYLPDSLPALQLPWCDLKQFFYTEPPPLDFVLPGFLAGTVGGLVSPGGVGKSTWALEVALEIACEVAGGQLIGMDMPVGGDVVMLAAEDPAPALHHRIAAIAKHLPPDARDSIMQHFKIAACAGMGANLFDSQWLAAIADVAKTARLVIIDTLSRFHCLDENSGQDAKAIMAKLEMLATSTGASILYLHHVNKAAALGGMADLQQAARGSSVFVDNARWLSFVSGMSKEEAKGFGVADDMRHSYMRWNISKQNYGAPLPDRWYRRGEGGVLLPTDLIAVKPAAGGKRGRRDDL